MFNSYQNNLYDLDTISVTEMDFDLSYNYSTNFNYGDYLQDLSMEQPLTQQKVDTGQGKSDLPNPRDLTSLQWLQTVSIPMEQGRNRSVQVVVDPNTNLPIQIARQNHLGAIHMQQQQQHANQQQQQQQQQAQQVLYPRSATELRNLQSLVNGSVKTLDQLSGKENGNPDSKAFPKPVFSYSCLIAMALNNSDAGSLPVSEIYKFMQSKFPYFKTAPDGWKNSVRHNLSLNKAFCKLERPDGTSQRKGCLWSLKPEKQEALGREIRKWKKKHPEAIKASMANPEELNVSSDSMDDSLEDQSSSVIEHIVPDMQIKMATNHLVSQAHDEAAAADAAKELFGNDLFPDTEEFWNEILQANTSEPNVNYIEMNDPEKLPTDNNQLQQQTFVYMPQNQAATQSLAGF